MKRRLYIQTEAETANLAELLLLEITALRNEITGLNALVKRLHPPESVQLYMEEEAAALLNISRRTLIKLRNEKSIHYHRIEYRILYSIDDIREFEEKCRKPIS